MIVNGELLALARVIAHTAQPTYTFSAYDDPEDTTGLYCARCDQLPAVLGQGDTPAQAIADALDALADYIAVALLDGFPLPSTSRPATF